jgi:hypothetical protein
MKLDRDDANDLIALTRVPSALAALIDDEPPKYRYVANRIANADVPADLVEYIRGRYYVRRSNLAAFAEALGLRLKPSSLPLAAEPDAEPSKSAQNPSPPPAADTPAKPELPAKPEPAAKASKPARPRASSAAAA